MIYKPDLDNLKTPTRFLLAELDNSFKPDMVEYAKETLAKKGVPAEFTTYPGTCHGYAARGNLAIESVRKGFEGRLIESVQSALLASAGTLLAISLLLTSRAPPHCIMLTRL
jgi:dienelactone hydrolase